MEIIGGLSAFSGFHLPVLIGLSRKSFIGAVTGQSAERRDVPTIAANAIAIAGGADIIRVHNVAAHLSAAQICDAIIRENVSRET
jgi:dihydropteroate synthase